MKTREAFHGFLEDGVTSRAHERSFEPAVFFLQSLKVLRFRVAVPASEGGSEGVSTERRRGQTSGGPGASLMVQDKGNHKEVNDKKKIFVVF